MKADEQKAIEHEPSKSTELWNKTRSYIDFRIVGVVVVLLIVAGVWWYAAKQTRSSTSKQWKTYELLAMQPGAEYQEFAEENSNDLAGQVAAMEVARRKLNADGIAKLALEDPEEQQSGLDNIIEARDSFLELANAFDKNPVLKVQALLSAADAEVALAGIPKTPGGSDYRGSVKEAASLHRRAAKVLGEETDFGKTLMTQADQLEKNSDEVIEVSIALHARLTPTTTQGAPGSGPKPPIGLQTPIETPLPGTGPNAPGPLTIPTPKEEPMPSIQKLDDSTEIKPMKGDKLNNDEPKGVVPNQVPSKNFESNPSFDIKPMNQPNTIMPRKVEPKKEAPKAMLEKVEPKQEEPKIVESKKESPKKIEPKKEAPKKIEPKKEEPKMVEPKKVEPKKPEPAQVMPKKEQPKKEEPKNPEPKKVQPKPEPKKEAPKKPEPRKEQPKKGKPDDSTEIKPFPPKKPKK